MRVLYLPLIFQLSFQLQCDKTIIHATVGRELHVSCSYDVTRFRFSKKYWCQGESRNTCEIVMDTDGFIIARLKHRVQILLTGYNTFHITMRGLQKEDAGIYWVGIDKIYADILLRIQVDVNEEAVIRPRVRLVGFPQQTCQGESILLRCKSERGTSVQYSWYREAYPQDVLLQSSSDLLLHCSIFIQDAQFFCVAQNVMSRERSELIFIHLLQPGLQNCAYLLASDDVESYECRTTTSPTTTTITTTCPVEISSSELVNQATSGQNHSLHVNRTWKDDFFFMFGPNYALFIHLFRSWSGVPVWYDIARWSLFIVMVSSNALMHRWIKTSLRGHDNHRRL